VHRWWPPGDDRQIVRIGEALSELADQRFVLRERGSTTRRAFEVAIQDEGLTINPVFEIKKPGGDLEGGRARTRHQRGGRF
jgi:hypothetical protein